MKQAALRLLSLAVAVCLFSGSLARADDIADFNFTPAQTTLFATNNPGLANLVLSNQAPTSINNFGGTVTATLFTTNYTGPNNGPTAIFTNVPYALTLYITDKATNQSNQMYFYGLLNGTVTDHSASFTNVYTNSSGQVINGPDSITKTIGSHVYTVTMLPYNGPSNPTSLPSAVQAKTTVTPEPSTFALAGLALVTMGGGWWFRRRRPLAMNLA